METNQQSKKIHLLYLFIPLLLLVNAVLGGLLLRQSSSALIGLIQDHMLDMSGAAASLLDGDVLMHLTREDEGAAEYQQIAHVLSCFQKNAKLQYIYCVQPTEAGGFAFSVKPTANDPGEFGVPVVVTEALRKAAQGAPAVDDKPYTDAWGSFYSAYSPVFTADGRVGGIVVVDFSADWYDQQASGLIRTTVLTGVLSLAVCVVIVALITYRTRRRYLRLYGQLNELAGKVEELVQQIESRAILSPSEQEKIRLTARPAEKVKDIDTLTARILSMQDQILAHLEYVQAQAYLDGLTGIGNSNAYLDVTRRLDGMIQQKTAAFSVAVFDLNDLKNMNDIYGHDCGNAALIDAAEMLIRIWGKERVFRIGGDEFAAVMEAASEEEMRRRFQRMDEAMAEFNKTPRSYRFPLSLSKGAATYRPGKDESYKAVFKRADLAMYEDKRIYYQTFGDRRKR